MTTPVHEFDDEPEREQRVRLGWCTPSTTYPAYIGDTLATLSTGVDLSIADPDGRVYVGAVTQVTTRYVAIRPLGRDDELLVPRRRVAAIGVVGPHGWLDRRFVADRQRRGEWLARAELGKPKRRRVVP